MFNPSSPWKFLNSYSSLALQCCLLASSARQQIVLKTGLKSADVNTAEAGRAYCFQLSTGSENLSNIFYAHKIVPEKRTRLTYHSGSADLHIPWGLQIFEVECQKAEEKVKFVMYASANWAQTWASLARIDGSQQSSTGYAFWWACSSFEFAYGLMPVDLQLVTVTTAQLKLDRSILTAHTVHAIYAIMLCNCHWAKNVYQLPSALYRTCYIWACQHQATQLTVCQGPCQVVYNFSPDFSGSSTVPVRTTYSKPCWKRARRVHASNSRLSSWVLQLCTTRTPGSLTTSRYRTGTQSTLTTTFVTLPQKTLGDSSECCTYTFSGDRIMEIHPSSCSCPKLAADVLCHDECNRGSPFASKTASRRPTM